MKKGKLGWLGSILIIGGIWAGCSIEGSRDLDSDGEQQADDTSAQQPGEPQNTGATSTDMGNTNSATDPPNTGSAGSGGADPGDTEDPDDPGEPGEGVGCVNDNTCTLDDDCVCADCDADEYCSDPANCVDDNVCDAFTEGCVCADCAAHPECVS